MIIFTLGAAIAAPGDQSEIRIDIFLLLILTFLARD